MESIFLEELKKFMELDDNNTENDEVLNIALNAAQGMIDKYCNISTTPATKVLILNGTGLTTIPVDYLPITSIDALGIGGEVQNVLDFYIDRSTIGSLSTTFTSGIRNIDLTLTVGYPTVEDIPYDLLIALLKIAEKFYTDAAENREGMSGYNTNTKVGEDFVVSELPSGVETILQLHKRYVL